MGTHCSNTLRKTSVEHTQPPLSALSAMTGNAVCTVKKHFILEYNSSASLRRVRASRHSAEFAIFAHDTRRAQVSARHPSECRCVLAPLIPLVAFVEDSSSNTILPPFSSTGFDEPQQKPGHFSIPQPSLHQTWREKWPSPCRPVRTWQNATPFTRPKTTQSRRELPPNLLLSRTSLATSPANWLGIRTQNCSSISKPPMQQWITGEIGSRSDVMVVLPEGSPRELPLEDAK